jgi:hypothetical protein
MKFGITNHPVTAATEHPETVLSFAPEETQGEILSPNATDTVFGKRNHGQ